MSVRYQDHLIADVLNDGKTVSYRTLSRALKVHVNIAKQMLYDFYQTQNSIKPGSIHATYLLCGVPKSPSAPPIDIAGQTNGNDTVMSDIDNPFSSSMPEPEDLGSPTSAVTAFSLASQERLQATKQSYDTISSIHLYSIEPGPLSNIHILTEGNRVIFSNIENQDPLQTWKLYGTIRNPMSKRRSPAHRTVPTSASQAASTAGMKPLSAVSTTAKEISIQTQNQTKTPLSKPSSVNPSRSATSASVKSTNAPSFFASFLAAGKKESNAGGASKDQSNVKDAHMSEAPLQSDDEGEEDAIDSLEARVIGTVGTSRKAKHHERMQESLESKLQAEKTEFVDEPMTDTRSDEGDDELDAEDTVDASKSEQPEPVESAESQENVTTSDGRRRGRRTVMKKVKYKEGNRLVTKMEPTEEYFSEDEPNTQGQNKPNLSAATSSGLGKSKKTNGTSKQGKGSIKSFFEKK